MAAFIERLSRHNFEQITTLEAGLGTLDQLGIFARIVITARQVPFSRLESLHWCGPIKIVCG
ncbi:hypothetical protein D3C80_600130 [compost metagenome]